MTFQLKDDIPGFFGGENRLRIENRATGLGSDRPEVAYSVDPQELSEIPHSDIRGQKVRFAPHVQPEDLTLYEVGSFKIHQPLKPHFPPKLQEKVKKMMRRPLKTSDKVSLIDEICTISAEFYKVRKGKFIAVRLDGTVVESADSEIDLLLKVQGRQFGVPVFVHEVGVEGSPGWST